MDKESLIEALSEWNFWENDLEAGVSRDWYLDRLDRLLGTGQVVAITGVRRSGKSTLMRQFIRREIARGRDRRNYLYVNFEEARFAGMLSLEFLIRIHEAYTEIVNPPGRPCLLLDEVQNVPGWERFVRSLHERNAARIIVSGSTSQLLGRELGSLLTGRWVELRTYPLDFREFLAFKGLRLKGRLGPLSQKVRIRQLLREYLEFGGFPLVVLKDEKKEILGRYFDDILERDVASRHRIRASDRLRALARYHLTNYSALVSYRRIAKFLGLSLHSVERFSQYMTDAGLVFFAPKFSCSLKEQQVNPRKVYGVDAGLLNIVGFRFSENVGKLYENLVQLALVRGGGEVFYYKNKWECDFVVKRGQRAARALQVCYQIEDSMQREVRGLLAAMNALSLKEGTIVTEDKAGEEIVEGKRIVFVPLWKWLLTGSESS